MLKTRQGLKPKIRIVRMMRGIVIAAMLKTRQGLKLLRSSERVQRACRNRSDAENPTGIETILVFNSATNPFNRSDAENPTGIETEISVIYFSEVL